MLTFGLLYNSVMSSITIPSDQWEQIRQFLRDCPGVYVGDPDQCKQFAEGALWINRSGAQWRLLPTEYAKWNTVYKRCARRCERGVWELMHRHFGAEPDLEYPVSTVRWREPTSALGVPRRKRGAIRASPGPQSGRVQHEKVPVSVDGLGNPLRFTLTPGQQHDITRAEALLSGCRGECVIADQGYDAQQFIEYLTGAGMVTVVPARANRKEPREYDTHLYRERHVVECCIGKIKRYRRVFYFPGLTNWPADTWDFCNSLLPSSGCVEMSTLPSVAFGAVSTAGDAVAVA